MAVTSLAVLSLAKIMDHFDEMEEILSVYLPPSLKLSLFPLLCKRGLIMDSNICKFVHSQTSELELTDCDINDDGLRQISVCTGLQVLNLNANKGTRDAISSKGLQDMFMSCCNLKSVQLKRCVNVDDSCISILAEHCRGLSVLNIHGCHRVGDRGLVSLADRSQYLESLDLTRTAVSEDGLALFANGLSKTRIKELNLSHCNGTTDQAVHLLIENCPNLKMLMLHSCPNVTGESRELLSHQLPGNQRKFKQITWTISF